MLGQTLDSTANRKIGAWDLRCEVDAITDESRCRLILAMRNAEATPPLAGIDMVETRSGIEPVVVLPSAFGVVRVLLRVDRQQPETAPCQKAEGGMLCWFAPERRPAIAEQLRSGVRAVLRVERDRGPADYEAPLAEAATAIEEYLRLDRASGRKIASGARLEAEAEAAERERGRKMREAAAIRTQAESMLRAGKERCAKVPEEARAVCRAAAERCVGRERSVAELNGCVTRLEQDPVYLARLELAREREQCTYGMDREGDRARCRDAVKACAATTLATPDAARACVAARMRPQH